MSNARKNSPRKAPVPGYTHIRTVRDISEYRLNVNGLTVLHQELKGTGVITTNITYRVGSRDEARGETGLAHMLEHMLFKPTAADLKAKIDSGAMQFERDTGCILNANTWLDRTTYFFSYPKEHLVRALAIEADRMTNVVLTDKEFLPERNNVLSEFDMYFGDPHFALGRELQAAAFMAHPYGHETIGTREDIEDYTPEKLERFYRTHYRPDNAAMMVLGDVDLKTALSAVKATFGGITRPALSSPSVAVREPAQQGIRRVELTRPSTQNLIKIGLKHEPLADPRWHHALALLSVLVESPDSILNRAFVDTGIVSSISSSIAPTKERGLAELSITLAPNSNHQAIETQILERIKTVTKKEVTPLLKKYQARQRTETAFAKLNSLSIARELTEYWSAGDWTLYYETEKITERITPEDILKARDTLFAPANLTIGYFIGTSQ